MRVRHQARYPNLAASRQGGTTFQGIQISAYPHGQVATYTRSLTELHVPTRIKVNAFLHRTQDPNRGLLPAMISKDDFENTREENPHGILVLDGALATELERRGHNLEGALWSAEILRTDPAAIKQVHLDYYLAGANVVTTASYQASVRGLSEHCGMSAGSAVDLIRLSVELACQARDAAYASGRVSRQRRLLVAGSIGPFGAYLADGSEYRGDYTRTVEEFRAFHRPRIAALVDAGVDMLAIETMPNHTEIQAVLSLLNEEFPTAIAWLSCTVKDAEHLSDGLSLRQLASLANANEQIVALGVNCIHVDLVSAALTAVSSVWKRPLVCYPNSGEVYDAASHTWSGDRSYGRLAEHVLQWRTAGARLIGGCCRTGPEDIEQIVKTLRGA